MTLASGTRRFGGLTEQIRGQDRRVELNRGRALVGVVERRTRINGSGLERSPQSISVRSVAAAFASFPETPRAWHQALTGAQSQTAFCWRTQWNYRTPQVVYGHALDDAAIFGSRLTI